MDNDEIPEEYRSEKDEYIRLRDETSALKARLATADTLSEYRRLDAFYDVYVDDYWERLRSGRPTRSALDTMRKYLEQFKSEHPDG